MLRRQTHNKIHKPRVKLRVAYSSPMKSGLPDWKKQLLVAYRQIQSAKHNG